MYQATELSQRDGQWQPLECSVVAKLNDGREIRQVSELKCEVTLYKGAPASDVELSTQIDRLRRNFTQMKPDFFAVLANELTEAKWPAERIKDAVTSVMRTKAGGFFSIADIFQYDKPMKLYTHAGYCWLINNGRAKDADCCGEKSDFGKIIVDGKCFFYLKKDVPSRK